MNQTTDLSRPAVCTLDDVRQDPLGDRERLEQLRRVEREFGLLEGEVASEPWLMDYFTFPATTKYCREARTRIERLVCSAGVSEQVRYDIALAVGEAVANAVEHGNGNNPDGSFTVRCVATPKRIFVSVSDQGPGFDPEELPSLSEALLRDRGRGIHCILAVMDEVGFDFASGTTVRMVKFC